uniref:CEP152 CEP63 binding coiled coil domain-containing protein n=1 Tax=Poecilia mexicana TaxID=48701 RepID=A0A3B3XFU7_9TELE
MSIDFDSAALQTQHEEDEYDQEDYAREQELHKLLTDLPDDMLEDSRDSSSPELECSTYSNKNTGSSNTVTVSLKAYEVDYNHGSPDGYAYEDGYANGHLPHSLPPGWDQGRHFAQENRTNMDSDEYAETGDYSAECDPRLFPDGTRSNLDYNGDGGYRSPQCQGDNNTRNHFQVIFLCVDPQKLTAGPSDHGNNQFKVNFNPQHPAHQPKLLNPHSAQQKDQFEQLQREFLDSTQQTADKEQVAQLQVLNKAQQRQIEDLERKLEDSRRNMRYIEHQFAIVKDEKDGLAVSFRESSRLIEEAKKGETQMQNKLKALEQQVQILKEKDQEVNKLKVADAAVDSMKQQMLELCRSDTLSRARQQHDRDLAVMKEQHDAALLAVQQKLDSTSQALNDQVDVSQKLQQQVQQLERQREEEQLERARIVNSLSQRLEESQQQCAKLLQTHSVQEMSQMQIKLQQAQSAKTLSENINKVLQDMAELKEQITLYESALKHGVIAFDLSNDWENQLSESCMDLGLKKPERKNGTVHSTTMNHLSDSKLPKEEVLRLLRVEMQRCLGCLKGKRQKINQLQEELRLAQGRVGELEAQLEAAKLCSAVRMLEKKNKELKQNEEKLKSANSELCTKMREMIQELDQEKQEAAQRTERINQQYRDDVVNRVRTELLLEHNAEVEQLTAQHQQQIQQLQNQLSEVSDKMLAVQECYISVCKEKCFLEETLQKKQEEESSEKELQKQLEEAKKERNAAEVSCQTDELEASGRAISAEELDSRLAAQKQQLQLEADKVQRKAVAEARKLIQRELEEKHLNDMAKQVEGAVTRAYSRWIEDLSSLPEYQTLLQREKDKWEELQEEITKEKVSQALQEAEEEWRKNQVEQQNPGDLQEELAALKSQLEQASREQAALLKAELAAARAAWFRDKQEDADLQRKELLLQPAETEHQEAEDGRRTGGSPSESTITNIIETSCRDMMNRALTEAKKEWKKMSEEKLSCILKETHEKHTRQINEIQGSLARRKEQPGCRKGCTESLGKLQKKNQELHRHLEKACRQLQHRIREHKTAVQQLRDEHESSIQKLKEEHLQQLEEVKRANESSGSDHQQNLQQGLEEMKQQYLVTVEKIRGDMLRYLQESRERAAEMIRSEVQRERQDTARKMRRYYLTCLQELLEDGGKATGAEKKIMSAASKLAAMAKVLETPVKSNSGKNYSPPTTPAELQEKVSADSGPKSTAAFRTKPLTQTFHSEDGSVTKPQTFDTNSFPHKPSQSHVGFASLSARGKSAEWFLQRGDSSKAELARQSRPFLVQEAPVREEKQTDWSLTDSDRGPNAARPRREGDPLRPFSANSASDADIRALGVATPDDSDLTVYKEIPKQSLQTENNKKAKKSLAREPIPGSDGDVFSRPPFSELRQRLQDSGFDSPFYLQK